MVRKQEHHIILCQAGQMAIIRVNSNDDGYWFHESVWRPACSPDRLTAGDGPVIVMIHGYSYQPGHSVHCPHRHILSMSPSPRPRPAPSWPLELGFGAGDPREGIGVAFGWPARGSLWRARRRAVSAGQSLAAFIIMLRDYTPHRNIHMAAHSLGIEVVAEALHHLPPGAVGRIISMTGASYQSRVISALKTPAGRGAEFFNVTSRENDLFDCLFEQLITPPSAADRALGHGLDAPNVVTLQLDCPDTLAHLARLGATIEPSSKRVCHWSAYLRPGILPFYRNLLRQPHILSLNRIRAGLPTHQSRRWSRLFARPAAARPLFFVRKPT